jgi:GGDEF domain-containing protein
VDGLDVPAFPHALRAKFLFVNGVVVLPLLWLSAQAWQASGHQQSAQARQVALADVRQLTTQAGKTHDALRVFAQAMRHSVQAGDVAGRWGVEAFAIVLVGSDAAAAQVMVERLNSRLAQLLRSSKSPAFAASFGIADCTISRHPATLPR